MDVLEDMQLSFEDRKKSSRDHLIHSDHATEVPLCPSSHSKQSLGRLIRIKFVIQAILHFREALLGW